MQGLPTVCRGVYGHTLTLDAFNEMCDRVHFWPRERDPFIALKVILGP